jgi:hypothetical protein
LISSCNPSSAFIAGDSGECNSVEVLREIAAFIVLRDLRERDVL